LRYLFNFSTYKSRTPYSQAAFW